MSQFLRHLFLPRQSNNHRSKILHNSSLFLVALLLLLGQFVVSALKTNHPSVLGISIAISTEQLLDLTNQKRQKEHLDLLKLNNTLSKAAKLKAEDMFAKNYWAHNGPDGTVPWFFFKKAGYEYVYAGENLARGFTDSKSVVEAWMASPTHRENILSPNYEEIGFAIKEGKLLGEETVLVVELFGNTHALSQTSSQQNETLAQVPKQEVLPQFQVADILQTKPLVDSSSLAFGISLFIVSFFITILLLDMIIVKKRNIARLVGHNLDHILFLSLILVVLLILSKGAIL